MTDLDRMIAASLRRQEYDRAQRERRAVCRCVRASSDSACIARGDCQVPGHWDSDRADTGETPGEMRARAAEELAREFGTDVSEWEA